MAKVRDVRSPVTRAQLVRYYADSDRDIWDLSLYGNSVLDALKGWVDPASEGFGLLNLHQRRLYYAGMADSEIGNGGFGQLVFNLPEQLHDMQEAYAAMGCVEAAELFARELARLESAGDRFVADLIRSRTAFAGINMPDEKDGAWEAFEQFCDEYYAPAEGEESDPVSELFSDLQPATHAAIFDYIRRNEDSFFRVVG